MTEYYFGHEGCHGVQSVPGRLMDVSLTLTPAAVQPQIRTSSVAAKVCRYHALWITGLIPVSRGLGTEG